MKIKEIKKDADTYGVYSVTLKPNWFQKLFGVKEKTKRFKDTGGSYWLGSGGIYVNEKGEKLGNGHKIGKAIDNWKHRF